MCNTNREKKEMKEKTFAVQDFDIIQLSNNGIKINLPVSCLQPSLYDTFLYKVNGASLCLMFSSNKREKNVLLEDIPINILQKIKKLKLISLSEKTPGNITSGNEMMFVNKVFFDICLRTSHA
tara:strand:- start:187 stop:555 length:369 start_codon:yes stop_codon:yes gene_type:complete